MIDPVLFILINESFTCGSYPNLFKVARVPQNLKSGTAVFIFLNEIPLSVLPVFNKVFEGALHSRFSNISQQNETIYRHQYDFLENKSTIDVIPQLTQEFDSAFNSEEHISSVFLDFCRSFDPTCHGNPIKNSNYSNKI